jgi:hypothetical protein
MMEARGVALLFTLVVDFMENTMPPLLVASVAAQV